MLGRISEKQTLISSSIQHCRSRFLDFILWSIENPSSHRYDVENCVKMVKAFLANEGCSSLTAIQNVPQPCLILSPRSLEIHANSLLHIIEDQLPVLHCTVIGFALDWESHKSLKHDHECLTELLERTFFQPYPIQRIQLAEVGWESDDKGFERKRVWKVSIKSCATFSVLVCC